MKMKESIVELLIKWEEDDNYPEGGAEHIFANITQSEVPVISANKYLCGLSFKQKPTINLVALEKITYPNTQYLYKNICKKCLEIANENYPLL